MSTTETSFRSYSVKGTFVVANSIKLSVATATSLATYSGGTLDGSIGAAAVSMPRRITATLAAFAAAYVNASTITITGLDPAGLVQTDTLTIVGTGGGTTLTSTKFFTQVTSIAVQAQASTSGAFTFGTSDGLAGCRQFRVGTGGDVAVQYIDGSKDIIPNLQAGESPPVTAAIILGTGTTAADISCFR